VSWGFVFATKPPKGQKVGEAGVGAKEGGGEDEKLCADRRRQGMDEGKADGNNRPKDSDEDKGVAGRKAQKFPLPPPKRAQPTEAFR